MPQSTRFALFGLCLSLVSACRIEFGVQPDSQLIGTLTFSTISTGATSTCALTTSGAAYCWGRNPEGQLGNGTRAEQDLPTPVVGSHTFASIHTDGHTTCALTPQGEAWCWGSNGHGQFGGALGGSHLVPEAVGGAARFTSISTRAGTTCGLATSGTAYCTTPGSDSLTPIGDGLVFTALSVTARVTCGIDTEGAAWCWGDGARGQLGNGSAAKTNSTVPLKVVGGLTFKSISVGAGHACAITTAGTLLCWGSNDSGQTGTGVKTPSGVPTDASGLRFQTVSAGSEATCATTTANEGYCWGWAAFGGLGVGRLGLIAILPLPTKVAGGARFAVISNSDAVSCGVSPTHVAYCWGDGGWELGLGAVGEYGVDAPKKVGRQAGPY